MGPYPGLPNFQDSKTSHIADKYIIREQITNSFSYMGHNVGGGGLGGGYDWAHLASQLSSHLNQSACKIWKQSYNDIVCYGL